MERTSVVDAVLSGRAGALAALLDGGRQADEPSRGTTPLIASISSRDKACFDILIAGGADPDLPDEGGSTPLLRAIADVPEFVEALIQAGANCDIPADAKPLVMAAYLGREGCMRSLINAGCDANTATEDGVPVLSLAKSRGCAEVLIEGGADPNKRDRMGRPPLSLVPTDCVKCLIDAGADVDLAGHDGWTPLMRSMDVERCDLLIAAGADIEKRDLQGNTPLMCACFTAPLAPSAGVIKHLVGKGADVNAKNDAWETVLHHASSYDIDTIRDLVGAGAAVDARDLDGQTPLMRTAMISDGLRVGVLCSLGASVDAADNQGKTALIIAAEMANYSACEELLDRGADVHASDIVGRTALVAAVQSGPVSPENYKEIAHLLVTRGARAPQIGRAWRLEQYCLFSRWMCEGYRSAAERAESHKRKIEIIEREIPVRCEHAARSAKSSKIDEEDGTHAV